jgi:hypothetical protein
MTSDEEFRARSDAFWNEIIRNPDGTLNEEQIMNEFHDMYFMIKEVPKVYSAVTGGMLSKPNYYAESVLQCHEEYIEELMAEARREAVLLALDMQKAGHTRSEILKEFPVGEYYRGE